MEHRTHLVEWQDPKIAAKAAREMSGLEFMQAFLRGEIPAPPISALIGIKLEEVEQGRVVFSLEPHEYHYNPVAVVHGGILATLCDSAMALAIHTLVPAGVGQTTVELKVNYTRSLTVHSGKVFCEGKVIHSGSRLATAECRVVDKDGKLYAHGSTTCMILK